MAEGTQACEDGCDVQIEDLVHGVREAKGVGVTPGAD